MIWKAITDGDIIQEEFTLGSNEEKNYLTQKGNGKKNLKKRHKQVELI